MTSSLAFFWLLVPFVDAFRSANLAGLSVPTRQTTSQQQQLQLQLQQHLLRGPQAFASSALLCQLLGMNCANPTEFALSWPSFCERGGKTDIHADGWGLAYYQGSSLRQFHDVEPACSSALAQFMGAQPIETRNMLAYIRYATAGSVDLANVHPFSREMWGIQWCFCHNGQVPLFEDKPKYQLGLPGSIVSDNHNNVEEVQERIYHPIGSTDSEAAFCAILNALRSKFTDTMPSLPVLYEQLQLLGKEIVSYNPTETIFNFLLSCGPHSLWVYSWPGKRPGSKVWNGLYYTIRKGDTDLRGCDGDAVNNYGVSIHGQQQQNALNENNAANMVLKKNGIQQSEPRSSMPATTDDPSDDDDDHVVCIVATKPLTCDEEWIELNRGELL